MTPEWKGNLLGPVTEAEKAKEERDEVISILNWVIGAMEDIGLDSSAGAVRDRLRKLTDEQQKAA